jgi:hypothetical protein
MYPVEVRMKALQVAALAAAVSVGLGLQADAGMGGASASASAHATAGNHGHGFGFRRPTIRFHSPHFRFGDFRSHELGVFMGGAGDFDYASDEGDYGPDAGDDIDNLHFRVQEPFGPGDIGRPPVRADADARYLSDRMEVWHGYGPQDR